MAGRGAEYERPLVVDVEANDVLWTTAKGESHIVYGGDAVGGGSGITGAATAAYSATAGLISIYNLENDSRLVEPDHLQLRLDTIPTGTLSGLYMRLKLQSGESGSGGSEVTAGTNGGKSQPNGNTQNATASRVRVGALTLAAEDGTTRRLRTIQLKSSAPVAGEIFQIYFNQAPPYGAFDGGRVMIPYQWSLRCHVWIPGATSAPTWDVDFTMKVK